MTHPRCAKCLIQKNDRETDGKASDHSRHAHGGPADGVPVLVREARATATGSRWAEGGGARLSGFESVDPAYELPAAELVDTKAADGVRYDFNPEPANLTAWHEVPIRR